MRRAHTGLDTSEHMATDVLQQAAEEHYDLRCLLRLQDILDALIAT